jgi:hypothetical protein
MPLCYYVRLFLSPDTTHDFNANAQLIAVVERALISLTYFPEYY